MKIQQKLKIALLGVISMIFMAACTNDDEGATPDTEETSFSVSVTSPEEGQEFGLDEEVHIQAVAKSGETLHGYDIIVLDNGEEEVLHNSHEHEAQFDIHHHWTPAYEAAKEVQVIIRIYQSHEGDIHEEKVNISFVDAE